MSALALAFAAGLFAGCADAESVVRPAAEHLDRGEWAEAERLLQPLAALDADCAGVLLGRARLRAARGDLVEAERLLARAARRAPGEAAVQAHLAQYWLSRGLSARADYLSTLALSLDPDCADALVVQAQLLTLRGRLAEAREALERAVRADPAHAEARYQLGIWFYRRQLHPQAVEQLEKATALRPADARAHDYLALSLQGLGEAERAEKAYRDALAVRDGPFPDPFLDYYYGRFLLDRGRLEESRSHLDRAVMLHPDARTARYERARLNLALGAYADARKDAERARDLRDPSVLDVQVYYLLATVYARLGESELARRYAELSRTTPIPEPQ